eukprot:gene1659-20523_t
MRKYDVPLALQREAFTLYPHIIEQQGPHAPPGYDIAPAIIGLPPSFGARLSACIRVRPLRQVAFVRTLPDTATVDAGELVQREGDPGAEMYIIHRGVVEVLRAPPGGTPGDPASARVCTLKEGQHFGLLSLLRAAPRAVTTRCLTGCELFVLPAAGFTRLCDRYDEVRATMEQALVRRMREWDLVLPDPPDSLSRNASGSAAPLAASSLAPASTPGSRLADLETPIAKRAPRQFGRPAAAGGAGDGAPPHQPLDPPSRRRTPPGGNGGQAAARPPHPAARQTEAGSGGKDGPRDGGRPRAPPRAPRRSAPVVFA